VTTAKLKPAIADGHGLTPRIVDRIYDDLVAGRDPGTVIGLSEFKAVEHGEKSTANGTLRWVRFEVVKSEPFTDAHEADQARWQLKLSWDKRHGGTQLPMDFATQNDDDQRRHLLGLVDEWATEEGLTPTDVAERWRTQWGIDGEDAGTDGAFVHPDINKAAVHHVKEFAYMVGVLADAPETATTDEDDEDEA
jgi:hypothetical protein